MNEKLVRYAVNDVVFIFDCMFDKEKDKEVQIEEFRSLC